MPTMHILGHRYGVFGYWIPSGFSNDQLYIKPFHNITFRIAQANWHSPREIRIKKNYVFSNTRIITIYNRENHWPNIIIFSIFLDNMT